MAGITCSFSKRLCFKHFGKCSYRQENIFNRGVIITETAFSTNVSSLTRNSLGQYDVVVVGAGIIGSATARELKMRHPNLKMAVVEKEDKVSRHQSGSNSGVVHAGIYYKPGTLKAKLCVEGLHLMYNYCDKNNIPYKKVGKLIVAVTQQEIEKLNSLYQNGIANKVPEIQMVDSAKIKEIEPHCQGLKAIWSPHTGIVDYSLVASRLIKDFVEGSGKLFLNFDVQGFERNNTCNTDSPQKYPIVIRSQNHIIEASNVLTCAGLHADRLAVMSGCPRDPRIIPFRGEYLLLKPSKRHLVKGNIYPVPDPRFPFLGVHFTPRMDGSMWLGPNAVLAFKREGYRWSDFSIGEMTDLLKYPGIWKLATKYWRQGLDEISRSFITRLQVKTLQKFVPELQLQDVTSGPAGIRAQAVDINGNLVEDFVFSSGTSDFTKGILHCRNAPSPGATSSLAIAKMIADRVEKEFKISV